MICLPGHLRVLGVTFQKQYIGIEKSREIVDHGCATEDNLCVYASFRP